MIVVTSYETASRSILYTTHIADECYGIRSTSGPEKLSENKTPHYANFSLLSMNPPKGDILCNISLIYCLLGYIRIYIEKQKSALKY